MTLKEAIAEAATASEAWYDKTRGVTSVPPVLVPLSIEAVVLLTNAAAMQADDTVEIVTITE